MSKDTAARPDEPEGKKLTGTMTEDELTNFHRLQTKFAADKAAKDAEAKKERDEEVAKAAEEAIERQRHHVVIRHIGRSKKTKTLRASRSGHRRMGVVLSDGTRIRMKGRQRAVNVSLERLVDNHRLLLEYVRVGQIEICDPLELSIIPYADLLDLIMEMGQWVCDKRVHDIHVAYEATIEKYNSELDAYEKAKKEWTEAVKVSKKSGAAVGSEPTPPVEPEEPDTKAVEFKLDPKVKYPDEPVEKLPSDLREDPSATVLEDPPAEAHEDPPKSEDPTLKDVDAAAMMAAADQAEAQKSGEANAPPSEEQELKLLDRPEFDEQKLRKMGRAELDEIAKKNGIADTSKLITKFDVIEAILSSGKE